MEDEQIVDRRARIADRLGEGVGGLHGEARAIERLVERDIAGRHRARRRVPDDLAEPEILEEVAGSRLWHACFQPCEFAILSIELIGGALTCASA